MCTIQGQSDGIQVLKYAPKQAYVPHTDYFAYKTSADHNWDSRDGGTNRFATVFLYLSDVEVKDWEEEVGIMGRCGWTEEKRDGSTLRDNTVGRVNESLVGNNFAFLR